MCPGCDISLQSESCTGLHNDLWIELRRLGWRGGGGPVWWLAVPSVTHERGVRFPDIAMLPEENEMNGVLGHLCAHNYRLNRARRTS